MDKTYFKSKYVLIFILFLFVFIGGLNYKHWLVTNKLTPKRISLIYSMSKNDIDNTKLEKLLSKEFRQQGIEAIFDKLYTGRRSNASPFTEDTDPLINSISIVLN